MSLSATSSGSPTLANRVASADGAPETPAHKKLVKATQEFEGILISKLMEDFKVGLSSLSGDSPLAGSDTLNSLAIQSLSTALARHGGLGIAQMIVHQLEPSLNWGQQDHRMIG
jgi:Rod binding domain-containing protein